MSRSIERRKLISKLLKPLSSAENIPDPAVQIVNLSETVTRRGFVKTGVALVTGGLIGLNLKIAKAQSIEIALPHIRSRKDRWYPHSDKIGLPTLYDIGGPLDFYDQNTGNTHVREYYEDLAQRLLDLTRPVLRSTVGICHAEPNAIYELSRLEAIGSEKGGISPEQSDEIFFNDQKYGLWMALRMADIQARPSIKDHLANNTYLLNELETNQRPFAGLVKKYQPNGVPIPGDWWHLISGRQGNNLTCTGFGETRQYHISWLEASYFPIPVEEFSKYPRLDPSIKDEYYFLRLAEHGVGFDVNIAKQLIGLKI
jgi:hypothetical protein